MPVLVTGDLAAHGEPPLPVDHLRLYGSDATLTLGGSTLTALGQSGDEQRTFDGAESYKQSYDATIEHFLDGMQTGSFETSPRDNLKTLELVERAYELAGAIANAPAARS